MLNLLYQPTRITNNSKIKNKNRWLYYNMFKHLCTPAMIYLVISAITIVMAITRVHPAAIMSKVFFALLWTWFLNFLCSKGYKNVSWFLVLLPFILIFFGMFFMVREGMQKGQKKTGNVGQRLAYDRR